MNRALIILSKTGKARICNSAHAVEHTDAMYVCGNLFKYTEYVHRAVNESESKILYAVYQSEKRSAKMMTDIKLDLTKRIDGVEAGLTKQIVDVKTDLTKQIVDVKTDLTKQINNTRRDMKWLIGAVFIAMGGMYTKLDKRFDKVETDISGMKQDIQEIKTLLMAHK